MKVGFDLDNTISEAPAFFSFLSQALISAGHEVHIITGREPSNVMESAIRRELGEYKIQFTYIKMTMQKHDYILSQGIEVYFDDTDEFFHKLPESVKVFKIREPGNFCFGTGKWYYGDHTGHNIHESDIDRSNRDI